MERKSFEGMACSIAQCLEVVGEWWSMLIIRDAFLGIRRFDDFQKSLGISRNVLTQRLRKLVVAQVLSREPYQQHPVRYDYRLTDKGRQLWPVLTTMRQWGDRHSAPHGPPVRVVHTACGHGSPFELRCPDCGQAVSHRDVMLVGAAGADES